MKSPLFTSSQFAQETTDTEFELACHAAWAEKAVCASKAGETKLARRCAARARLALSQYHNRLIMLGRRVGPLVDMNEYHFISQDWSV